MKGIWEVRGGRRAFCLFKSHVLGSALDRGIRLADKRGFPGNRARWMTERDRIYTEKLWIVGWNPKIGAFVQAL